MESRGRSTTDRAARQGGECGRGSWLLWLNAGHISNVSAASEAKKVHLKYAFLPAARHAGFRRFGIIGEVVMAVQGIVVRRKEMAGPTAHRSRRPGKTAGKSIRALASL